MPRLISATLLLAPMTLPGGPANGPAFRSATELAGQLASFDHISRDGRSFAGGMVLDGRPVAIRYSEKDGLQMVSDPHSPVIEDAWSGGISTDGKSVHGHAQLVSDGVMHLKTFVWTTTAGFEWINPAPGDPETMARAFSGNGRLLAGAAIAGAEPPSCFLWTARDGLRSPADLFPDFPADAADLLWIRNDRKRAWLATTGGQVLHWVHGKRPVAFHDLPGGFDELYFKTATADGRTALGYSSTDSGYQTVGFEKDGTLSLLFPDLAEQNIPISISAGGRLVMGYLDAATVPGSFAATDNYFLDRTSGRMVRLSEILPADLPAMEGWTYLIGKGISDSGDTILGEGIDPEGNLNSWVLTGMRKRVLSLQPERPRPTPARQ